MRKSLERRLSGFTTECCTKHYTIILCDVLPRGVESSHSPKQDKTRLSIVTANNGVHLITQIKA